jgi:hypothetical protein
MAWLLSLLWLLEFVEYLVSPIGMTMLIGGLTYASFLTFGTGVESAVLMAIAMAWVTYFAIDEVSS